MPMKAFVGEPADADGNVVPCTRCDRRGSTWVQGERGLEPRCSWHAFDERLRLPVVQEAS
jgi:hypothetical protein